jgi:hypothetical protein
MRISAFCLVFAVAGAAFAAGQEKPGAQEPSPRAFRLDLRSLHEPGYEPGREVRLGLWDSPMSRLELAASCEQWAARNPGPTGGVVPFQVQSLPFRFRFDSNGQMLVLGPWSSKWDQLAWQDKIAAGAQTTYIAWVLLQILRHPR